MQKNNCKLKTIFKKGLSFSIALALGAAATSLNLAKTAEADAPDVSSARKVYLAGEKVEEISDATLLKVNGVEVDLDHIMSKEDKYLNFGSAGSDENEWSENVNVTVYDWSEIYKGTSIKLNDGDEAEVEAILGKIVMNDITVEECSVIYESLKKGELQTTDGTEIDNVDYAKHNGKDVQIKLEDSDVVFKLGKLEVTRAAKGVELVSGPTKYCYLAGEKINLDGLSLKLTYEDGATAEVAWTEDTQSNFSFDKEEVIHGGNIGSTISEITVTYTDPVSKKALEDEKYTFTLYVVSTQTKAAEGIASVTGTFAKLDSVNAVSLSEDSEKYTKLKSAFAENAQVIFAYDILAGYEASVGKMRVALKVGKNYAGQVVTVKHLANDEIETFVNKVDEDGNVTVEVNSLSPFMVVLGATEEDKAAAAETEQKNAEAAATQEATKASSTAAASKSASKSAKTGDTSVVAFSVFGFVALISAAVLAFMKKNRKNFEK